MKLQINALQHITVNDLIFQPLVKFIIDEFRLNQRTT